MKQSKVVALVRSWGRRAHRGWRRLAQGLAAMGKAHQKRSWWERSLLGVVAAGLVAGVGFSLLGSFPFGAVPDGGAASHGGAAHGGPTDVALESGGGDGTPQGPGAGIGQDASAAAVLPPGAMPGGALDADIASGAPDLLEPIVGADAGGDAGAAPRAGSEGEPQGGGDSSNAPETPQSAGAPSPRADVPVASISSMEWPVTGGVLRPFGWYRHPVFGDWRHASSVVLQPAAGQNVVTAALAGRVTEVVNAGGLWRVTIRHADGWETEYEGLSSVDVASYEVVATGQAIGTGPDASLGGVAFAVYRDGIAVDPSEILGEPASMAAAP